MTETTEPEAYHPNMFHDGYRYAVRFNDGSILENWTGRTMQARAEAAADELAAEFARDKIEAVRRTQDGTWETYPRSPTGT
jgi:hypothetical protein